MAYCLAGYQRYSMPDKGLAAIYLFSGWKNTEKVFVAARNHTYWLQAVNAVLAFHIRDIKAELEEMRTALKRVEVLEYGR